MLTIRQPFVCLRPKQAPCMDRHLFLPCISPSSLSTLSGLVDYTAVVASEYIAGKSISIYLTCLAYCFPLALFLGSPDLYVLKMHTPTEFMDL